MGRFEPMRKPKSYGTPKAIKLRNEELEEIQKRAQAIKEATQTLENAGHKSRHK